MTAPIAKASPQPDAQRLDARLAHLATLVDPAQPPYTRRAFTETYAQARAWLQGEMEAAGMSVSVDAGGNLVGVLPGTNPELAPLGVGSHIDTVVGGGRFDGIAGVLAGLEAAQSLAGAGTRLQRPLWVVDFLSEEPSEYGPSCVGSRAIAGTLDESMLAEKAPDGESLAEGLRRVGGDPERVQAGPIHGPHPFGAFVELHIEQGPVLESEGLRIGVVSGVVGIGRVRVTIEGRADHAGTTPMPARRDALAGAAEVIAMVHGRAQKAFAENGLLATIGRLHVTPNATNVVPAQVEMILEARCPDMASVGAFLDSVERDASAFMHGLGLGYQQEVIGVSHPTAFSEPVQTAIREAAERCGYPWRALQSGAGHDAMHLAGLCPAGMVFIPCQQGRSHASEEFASSEDLAAGTAVLLETLCLLDESLPERIDLPRQ